MKIHVIITIVLLSFITLSFQKKRPKVLVFSKTAGYHHKSIPNGIAAINDIAIRNDFEVDTTTNAALFNSVNLKQYVAVVFLNTTGTLFDSLQREALKNFIHAGGGYAGVHAATDTEFDWPWYGQLAGAYFESHPKQQEAKLKVVDASHLSTKNLPATWMHFDEWYNYKNVSKNIRPLITVDETTYTGGKNGENHPIAWYQNFEGGRVFYTGLGHTDACYTDPLFLKHLTGGLLYAIGKDK